MSSERDNFIGCIDYILNEAQENSGDSLVDIANEAFDLYGIDIMAENGGDENSIVIRVNK